MSIFKGPEGGFSSKRTVGLAYAILGIIMVLVGVFTERETDLDILLVVIGTSLTALGISSITYFGKPDIVNKNGITPPPKTPPKEDDPDQ